MPAKRKASPPSKDSTANLGFEAKLWLSADKLRNNMDAAEYKHVVLGRVFEYYLTQFAIAEGMNGGQWSGATWTLPKERPKGERGGAHQFCTPSCVVRLLVEMLAPYSRIYHPACGTGGMFASSRRPSEVLFAKRCRANARGVVQSEKFVESHGGSARQHQHLRPGQKGAAAALN